MWMEEQLQHPHWLLVYDLTFILADFSLIFSSFICRVLGFHTQFTLLFFLESLVSVKFSDILVWPQFV